MIDEQAAERERRLAELERSLLERRRADQARQRRLAFGLARLSPAASFTLASAELAGTSLVLEDELRGQLARYQEAFGRFQEAKAGRRSTGGIRIKIQTSDGHGDDEEELPKPIVAARCRRSSGSRHRSAALRAPRRPLAAGALPARPLHAAFLTFQRYDLAEPCRPRPPAPSPLAGRGVQKPRDPADVTPEDRACFAPSRRELRGIFAIRALSPPLPSTLCCAAGALAGTVSTAPRARARARRAHRPEMAAQTPGSRCGRAPCAPPTRCRSLDGVHLDTGRFSLVHPRTPVGLRQGVYEDDAILAVFRDLDLTFVLQVVVTLYALLLTHDAVSGERESGVLRLLLAHPVPRWKVLTAKATGNLLGLGLPLLVPLLGGWLVLLVLGVPLTGAAAVRLLLLLLAGLLLFAFFVVFGCSSPA